jgi:ketosteroid isomerase-like protein
MTPKEIAQSAYDCFASGGMETFASLFAEDATIVVNGMSKFSRTYNGVGDWMANHLAHLPSHY